MSSVHSAWPWLRAPAWCSASRRSSAARDEVLAAHGRRAPRACRRRSCAGPRGTSGRAARRSRASAALEDLLRAAGRATAALSTRLSESPRTLSAGGSRGGEREQLGVEERRAHLEAVGHAHPVGLHEQVVEQVGPQVEVEQAVERVGALPSAARSRGSPSSAQSSRRPSSSASRSVLGDVADPGAVGVRQAARRPPRRSAAARCACRRSAVGGSGRARRPPRRRSGAGSMRVAARREARRRSARTRRTARRRRRPTARR